MTIEIQTERPGLVLRQFTPNDSEVAFALVNRNRQHLSQYSDKTSVRYPDHGSMLEGILRPLNPERLRFGIWHDGTLVGTVNLTPRGPGAVLGYWVGSEFTRRGYASTAVLALCTYAFDTLRYPFLVASVHEKNIPSQSVLKRCGFISHGRASVATDLGFTKRRP